LGRFLIEFNEQDLLGPYKIYILDSPMISRRYRVLGRVQGVGFRYFVRQAGADLGLSGWVRNCHDGAVETVAEGSVEALEAFEQRLHEGPALSRVDQVESYPAAASGEAGFRIVHDARPEPR
jgi:acylphosphatase